MCRLRFGPGDHADPHGDAPHKFWSGGAAASWTFVALLVKSLRNERHLAEPANGGMNAKETAH
jgi:hypothetical protein